MAHDVAGDLEQPLLHGFVERLAPSRTARTIARHRSSLRRAGLLDLAVLEDVEKSICSIAMAAWPGCAPGLGGPAARADGASLRPAARAARCSAGPATSPANVSCRMSRWWSQAAASATGAVGAPRRRAPPTSSVSGRDAEARTPGRRRCSPSVVREPVDRRRGPPGDPAGYSAQLRAAATSERASAETLRESSGESGVTSAISESVAETLFILIYYGTRSGFSRHRRWQPAPVILSLTNPACARSISYGTSGTAARSTARRSSTSSPASPTAVAARLPGGRPADGDRPARHDAPRRPPR